MRKDEIVKRYYALVKQLEEPTHQVVLGGDSALVVMNVKEKATVLEAHVEPNILAWACLKGGRYCQDDPQRVIFDDRIYLNLRSSASGTVCVPGGVLGDVWVYSPNEMLLQHRQNLSGIQAEIQQLEALIQKSTFTARRV